MKLIVGLGNCGRKYKDTRHNVGFLMLDKILGKVKWKESSYGVYYKELNTIYLKPTTYMNLSGNAINYFVNYYKIKSENILIIYDDVDIDLGIIKIKNKGSSGGHNGIKSIIKAIDSENFLRIKIGISKNETIDTSNYVLGKLSKNEKQVINKLSDTVKDIISDFKDDKTPDYLMNKYN